MATLATTLDRLIAGNTSLRSILSQPGPLRRMCCVLPYTWRTGCVLSGTADQKLASKVFMGLPPVLGADPNTWSYLDRGYLAALAQAARPGDPRSLKRLWFATQCWGYAGDNRGPARTARIANTATWSATLTTTFQLVRSGNLALAHKHAPLTWWGESFFTKWFWTIGLGATPTSGSARAYILDRRARHGYGRLPEWNVTGRNASARYESYCCHVDGAAAASRFCGGDGEKVEFALYWFA